MEITGEKKKKKKFKLRHKPATVGRCVDCDKNNRVECGGWFHASPPRCLACGGRLEKIKGKREDIIKMLHHDCKSNSETGTGGRNGFDRIA